MDKYIKKSNQLGTKKEIREFIIMTMLASYWIIHKWEYDETYGAQKISSIYTTTLSEKLLSKHDYVKTLCNFEKDILKTFNYDMYSLMPGTISMKNLENDFNNNFSLFD